MRAPHARDDGSLYIRPRLVIPADDVVLTASTSGGPGGQHANRSLTRVVATFDVRDSTALGAADRAWLLERAGPVIRSSSSRHRTQGANREAALAQLAKRIAAGLERPTPRRATRPTRTSQVRRIEEKKARGRLKERRRPPEED
jgi:ribosome-associated protein